MCASVLIGWSCSWFGWKQLLIDKMREIYIILWPLFLCFDDFMSPMMNQMGFHASWKKVKRIFDESRIFELDAFAAIYVGVI